MINSRNAFASVVFGAVVLCTSGNGSFAGSITEPGELIGYALGAPLPEGVYFANTLSDGGFRGVDDHRSDLLVDIPVLAWSTSDNCCYRILGGKLWGYFAAPYVSFGNPVLPGPQPNGVVASTAGRDFMAMYNPFGGAGLVWDLKEIGLDGWGFSNIVGAYAPVDNELRNFGHNIWVFNERPALSYTGNKWNFTVAAVYGLTGNDEETGRKVSPDYLNVDVTLLKTIDKWTAGVVGFGSTDLSCIDVVPCRKQSQIAVGGYAGYDFTGITVGLYATTDVVSNNYFNVDGTKSYETRVWTRVIVPLWTPPKQESLK